MLPVAGSMLFMYIVMMLTDRFIGQAFGAQFLYILEQIFYQVPFTHLALTNYPLWSMSYELYGSLLVFSILAIFGLSKYRLYFYCLIMFYFFISEDSTYYALFVFGIIVCEFTKGGRFKISLRLRAAMLILGLILATTPLPRDNMIPYIGVYSYLKIFDNFQYIHVAITAGVIGSMLLFMSIIDSALSIKSLSYKVVMFLGKISFPLYLTHATVIYVISFVLHRDYADISASEFWVATLITILISIPVAAIFEKYVDVPSINLSKRISKIICR